MSDKLNEAAQDIAAKHGVILGKDDPILILQTMNERLLEENRKAQQNLLAQFKEEIENISSQWKDDAKEKGEKILNRSLSASKEVMAKTLHDATRESVNTIQQAIFDALEESRRLTEKAERTSFFAMISASATILGLLCTAALVFFK